MGWENSQKLCKPSTVSQVCITVSNSPNPLVFRWGNVNTENYSVVSVLNLIFGLIYGSVQLISCHNSKLQKKNDIIMGKLKWLTPALRTTHWPLLHGLPLQTTLNNQPNSFYGVEKYKKPTCYTIITAKDSHHFLFRFSRLSLFHFRPILHRQPAKTLFPQWTIGERESRKRKWRLFFMQLLSCRQSR